MNLAVIGAGAFGTALAVVQAYAGREVHLWGRDVAQMEAMRLGRENERYLPGVSLPDQINFTGALSDIAANSLCLLAIPAQQLDGFVQAHHQWLSRQSLVICAKGISFEKQQLLHDLLAARSLPVAGILSGPGFAQDMARGLPTALTLAGESALAKLLSSDVFRLYSSDDWNGVALGGALKNVVALACGVTMGAGFGESARAAVLARGFAEMRRLAVAMDAQETTLSGLSGLGDLFLTAASDKSRNFRAGLALGAGKPLPQGTIEGVATAQAAVTLAKQYAIEVPIMATVADLAAGLTTTKEAAQALMARPLKMED